MVFTVLVFAQLGHAMAVRSESLPSFGRRFATNPPLLGAVLLTVGLQLAVVHVPWLQCRASMPKRWYARTRPASIQP